MSAVQDITSPGVVIDSQRTTLDGSTRVADPGVSVPPAPVTTTGSAAGGGGGGFRFTSSLHLPNLPCWAKWAIGSALILGIPLYKKIFRIEGVVEKIVKAVVKEVEEVAPVIEKKAEELADALPEGSFLRQKMEMVEAIAKEVIEQSHVIDAFLDKVDDVKEDIEEIVEHIAEEDIREHAQRISGEDIREETQRNDKERAA